LAAVKTLFALSCNRCSFPGCDERLTDPQWNGVRADIAHIFGERPGAARYMPEMSDDDRNSVDNLILLCPNHHREIDKLRPEDWSAERLIEAKLTHESACERQTWAADGLLEFYASMAISDAADQLPVPAKIPTRLAIEKGPGDTYEVVNAGDADVFDVVVEMAGDGPSAHVLRLEEGGLRRLSPGGRWKALMYAKTMSDRGSPVVALRWKDASGSDCDAEFPL
jgi:hypothetical protein